MFRSATCREIECLLYVMGRAQLPPKPALGSPEESDKAYKRTLTEEVREEMLSAGNSYIYSAMKDAALRDEITAATGLAFACTCLNCPVCREMCTDLAEGILSVLERDLMQLLHGERSTLLENRPGIQFLLTGLTLALLYESVPEKRGFDELVSVVLVIMIGDPFRWQQALERYGPAPHRVAKRTPRTNRAMTFAGKQMDLRRAAAAARAKKNKGSGPISASAAYASSLNDDDDDEGFDPTVCRECKHPFSEPGMILECDCGAVTIQYRELLQDAPQEVSRNSASTSNLSTIEDVPEPRPRSHSI